MTSDERQRRYTEIHKELVAITKHKLFPDRVSEHERELREELGRLENELGMGHFIAMVPIDDVAVGEQSPTTNQFRAQVPFMITNAMRVRLHALGRSDDEIKNMKPDEAWKILNAANGP